MNANLRVVSDLSPYECSICQFVYTNPCTIELCLHVFCNDCLKSTMEFQKGGEENKSFYCPLCKVEFKTNDIVENDSIASEIATSCKKCSCNSYIKLGEWNTHITKCKTYLGIIEDNVKKAVVSELKPTVNRSTFNCPLCKVKNLDREALLKHVGKYHKKSEAVCPICVCQPWGDPNYITGLYAHLNKRHKFDYDTTVDYNEEEDDVLKKVLYESMQMK